MEIQHVDEGELAVPGVHPIQMLETIQDVAIHFLQPDVLDEVLDLVLHIKRGGERGGRGGGGVKR